MAFEIDLARLPPPSGLTVASVGAGAVAALELDDDARRFDIQLHVHVQGGLDPNKISDLGAGFGIIVR